MPGLVFAHGDFYMTNRELLNARKWDLSALDRKKQHTLQTELAAVPCPVCRTPLDALSAAGIDIDDYDFGRTKHNYCCPHCQAQLDLVVPVVSFGPGWDWQLKHEWLTTMLAKAWAYGREHPDEE